MDMNFCKKRYLDTVILGAGIAGLGAALRARELNIQYEIFEAKASAGGLLDNFVIDGYRFDNAVHLSFASEDKVRNIFDKTPYFSHSPDAVNFETDKWLKHPVQNNLYPLSATEKVTLIESLIQRPESELADNYESWLIHQYGQEIANRYPMRYTRKYWQCNADELSVSWIGNRLRRAKLSEILYGAFTDNTPNDYYTKEMRYPKEGGFKSFIQPLIDESIINYNHEVIEVNLCEKRIKFSNGTIVNYKNLINTLPLPLFIDLCGVSVPTIVKESANKLEATSLDLISVGFNKAIIKDLWFYIYDEDILASRAYSPSVKSQDNVPEGCSSLQFEIYNPGRNSQYTVDELKKNVIYAMGKMGIARDEDIVFLHHKRLPWGNVVFKKGMEEYREIVREYISNNKVKSAGRFGEWDYLWSNQSMLSGYNSF
ncbi:TPA: NAD(P)/FAD-dependent oxidoreductase [Yersinia enterocolitica]|uniref:protoporphyrinogen/coproporphyrinogen oxidase n=1 Tax=Yersinia enterocolitica TaxID=630 RepID=UPI0033055928|nr:NAD(P)-binding protein [Yersinia enterocolitica]EKN4808050.1 NAD(P)-binding protein [Yersinia enterocolitica]HDL7327004.1 NAD(P)-binding protein [Yersinia enterocolitica]HDL7353322.1 NAD(P)-binding protein [Yersinia enterocolitica]HDL7957909.1 NAD(P)-binding protein [Yersinia enterocolitica]